jgi:hypothetical protein
MVVCYKKSVDTHVIWDGVYCLYLSRASVFVLRLLKATRLQVR